MQYFTPPLANTLLLYIGKKAGENLVPEADVGDDLDGVREDKRGYYGMYSVLFCYRREIPFWWFLIHKGSYSQTLHRSICTCCNGCSGRY